jgi:hypothetical protein
MHVRNLIVITALCAFGAIAAPASAQTPAAPAAAPAPPAAGAALPPPDSSPSPASPGAAAPGAASAAAKSAESVITPPVITAGADPLAALAWLRGCWAGEVNLRKFTEQWTTPAAGMMLGLGHTVMSDKTLSYEFMRIEARPDGKIAYVAKPTDKAEEGFVFVGTTDDRGVIGYVFSNPARDFPQQIIYSHTPGNELFAYVKGKINGVDRQVIYPFHHVDCVSGKQS